MGRFRSVDGSATETITLRLPTWLLDEARQEALSLGDIPLRELLRNDLIVKYSRLRDERQ